MLHTLKSGCWHVTFWLPIPIAMTLLLECGGAIAADAAPATRYAIEQPAQDLGDALRAIARETGTSVLFDPRLVGGRIARPLSGQLSGLEAIRQAIQGSGLEAHVTPDGAVVVRAAARPVAFPLPAGSSAGVASISDGPTDVPARKERDQQRQTEESHSAGDELEVAHVEVTGTRLRRVDAEGPAPVNVYTAKDIERSGEPTLQRFLAGLTAVSMSTGEGASSRSLGQETVQLRGLPLGSTLVLINGRRVEGVGSSSGNVFNLGLIPIAAIERVEVVPLGSSAVYGGDALAGVVNVILKKSLEGISVTARAGAGRAFGDGGFSLATGGQGSNGSFLVMGSYSRSSPLSMQDRSFFRSGDFTAIGGGDQRLSYCSPGTVSSVDGSNLPGLSSSLAGIPSSSAGSSLQVSDFAATAGQKNKCNYYTTGNGSALIQGFETLGVHTSADYRLSRAWSAFGEAEIVRDRMHADAAGIPLSVRVPASNPFNPFGVDVNVTEALGSESGVLRGITRQADFARMLLGLRGEVGKGWEAELTASTAHDHDLTRDRNTVRDDDALNAALSTTVLADAFNPFTAGRAASDSVLQGIWSDTVTRARGRRDQLSAVARGPVGDLWAGPVELVVGADAGREWYDESISGTSETHGSRNSTAAYGELRAPLLRGGDKSHWDIAAVTLAARGDRYSDFGKAATFQGGLEFRPFRSLLIRASAATSFQPPTLAQTHAPESTESAADDGLTDPERNDELLTTGTVIRTTNKDLAPEKGLARGLGFVWELESSPGARVSATYWQMRIRDLITLLSAQTILDYESVYPNFVTRAASVDGQPGVVTSIIDTEVNFGRLDTSGTDLDAAYEWHTALGRISAGAGATRTSEYRVLLTPGADPENRLGRRFRDFWAPKWKGRLSLGLERSAWGIGLTSRYLGSYKDIGTSDRGLGNYWMHDLAGSVNLRALSPEVFPSVKAATVGLSVVNLTNRLPQFAQGAPYFDVTQADWRGRYFSAQLALAW